jgi:hypothetical protein
LFYIYYFQTLLIHFYSVGSAKKSVVISPFFFLDMPLTYKGKSNRESYSEEVLQRVLEDVRSGRLGKLAASH